MDEYKHFRFKNVLHGHVRVSEEILKEDYENKYDNLSTTNLRYIKNIHGIKNITVFDNSYEGVELLKNAVKITIITAIYHYANNKMIRRITKLKKINPNVCIKFEDEICYNGGGGGGLMQLIAFGNQSVPTPEKSNITFFKPSHKKHHSVEKSINKQNNKIDKNRNKNFSKIDKNRNKNFSKIKHSGR
jgi:hypothetical protein